MSLAKTDVVLVGGGHTHAIVLRMWAMSPWPDVRITLVSPHTHATYSGMMPGTLAGMYEPDEMSIDLVRRCAAAGVRFILGAAIGVDRARRELLIAGRPPLPFDVLSLGVGSVPKPLPCDPADDSVLLAIKPMQTFLARLDERLDRISATLAGRPLRATVLGGGASGIETALALEARFKRDRRSAEITLISSSPELNADIPAAGNRWLTRELSRRGIRVEMAVTATHATPSGLKLSDGRMLEVDLALVTTSATAPAWLAALGWPTDPRGFLLTRPTLQLLTEDRVFAVGDSGTLAASPTPKAGVYAVRQGRVLWDNLRRVVQGRPCVEYHPQRDFLKLIGTGDGRAVVAFRGWVGSGRWWWTLKNWIDRSFMSKHRDYSISMAMRARSSMPPADPHAAAEMRCLGCGGKVGAAVLSDVLRDLGPAVPTAPHVQIGLNQPDDAAILHLGPAIAPGTQPAPAAPADTRTHAPADAPAASLAATVDFFAAPLDDAFTTGRLAALNALSDIVAMGGQPHSALAIAVVPPGPAEAQRRLLKELLAGGLAELNRAGTALVGGHTIEGPQTTIGYTVLGHAPARPRTKAGVRVGDRWVLTKPLGTGILLAAHMRAQCRGEWLAEALEIMLAGNQTAAQVATEFGLRSSTDITGFGLGGHWLEVVRASRVSAQVDLGAIPLLPGVADLLARGIESTLAPSNRLAESAIDVEIAHRRRPEYAALFDPQTCGGLLVAVPEAQVADFLARCRRTCPRAGVIGKAIDAHPEHGPRLHIV